MDLRDAIGLLGLAILTAGSYLERPALGLIVPGAILVAVAILGQLRNRRG